MVRRIALAFASVLLPALASAHPGHGLDPSGSSLVHWLAEPEHALPLALAGAALAALWLRRAARRSS